MAKSSVTLKALCKLAAAGRSAALETAIAGAFGESNAKLKGKAVEMASVLALPLPLHALLAMAKQKQSTEHAEVLGRAIAIHATDEAVDAMIDVLRGLTPDAWRASMAAIGHALRFVGNPRATDRLIEVVEQSDGALRERASWALRGRRPRDPRAAALGARLSAVGDANGKLLRLGQADPDEILDLVDECTAGNLPATLFTFRPDVVARWLASYAERALAGDADAAAHLIEVADSAKGFSVFQNLFREDVFGPPLIAIAERGDATLLEGACAVYQWLPAAYAHRTRFFDAALARIARGEPLSSTLGRLLDQWRHDAAIPILVDVLHTRGDEEARNAAWGLEGQDLARVCAALDAARDRTLTGKRREEVALLREKLGGQIPSDGRDAFIRVLERHHLDDLRAALTAGAAPDQAFDEAGVRPLHLLLRAFKAEHASEVAACARLLVEAGADPHAAIASDVELADSYRDGDIKFFAGDTPASLVVSMVLVVGRPAVDAVVSALGIDSTDAMLRFIARS